MTASLSSWSLCVRDTVGVVCGELVRKKDTAQACLQRTCRVAFQVLEGIAKGVAVAVGGVLGVLISIPYLAARTIWAVLTKGDLLDLCVLYIALRVIRVLVGF